MQWVIQFDSNRVVPPLASRLSFFLFLPYFFSLSFFLSNQIDITRNKNLFPRDLNSIFFPLVMDRFLSLDRNSLIFFDRYINREFSNFCRPIIRGGMFGGWVLGLEHRWLFRDGNGPRTGPRARSLKPFVAARCRQKLKRKILELVHLLMQFLIRFQLFQLYQRTVL